MDQSCISAIRLLAFLFATAIFAWLPPPGFDSPAFGQSGSLFNGYRRGEADPVQLASYQSPNVGPVVLAQGTSNPTATPSPPLDTMSVPPTGGYPQNAYSQNLYGAPANSGAGLNSSWTYIPPAQTRRIKIHDIVSIRVDESANSLLLGNATSRKTTTYDAVVRDWIRLSGLDTLKPSPQSDGDPRAQINQNEVYRGDSTLRTSESISFNIAAQVVDILPNGLIVLEGNTTITLNDNSMEVALIGTCRSEDIAPDNTVLSRNLVNKHIKKREDGHVRDGYSRGWLTRLFAKIKPF